MPTRWNDLCNLFYPRLCLLCRKPLVEGEEQVCLECLCDLPQTGYPKIPDNPVEQLLAGKVPLEHGSAFLHYEKSGKTRRLIHSLKYNGNKELGFLLGRQAALDLVAARSPLCHADLLIPLPLHPRKERKRGYNQSRWIADGLASVLGIPVRSDCVCREVQTDSQTHRPVYERWRNTCSIFTVLRPEALENKHVVLVDDVITTGATLTACAVASREVPGIRVSVFALSVT